MRPVLTIAVVALVVAGAVAAVAVTSDDEADDATPTAAETSEIARGDIVEQVEIEGVLARTALLTISHTGAGGTVTWVPEPGAVLDDGDTAYEIEGAPVVVLRADTPLWRPLEVGVDDGDDVEALERALVENGFDPDGAITVDGSYSSATAAAVERWQDAAGLEASGEVRPGEVVVVPTAGRVDAALVDVGDVVAGGPILTLTEPGHVVEADTPVDLLDDLAAGLPVTVRFTDRSTLDSTIAAVESQPSGEHRLVVPVDGEPVPELTGAPVDVVIDLVRAEDELLVTVEAIVRTEGEGYAVRLTEGDGVRLVAVAVVATDGRVVAVTGDVEPGDVVVVS